MARAPYSYYYHFFLFFIKDTYGATNSAFLSQEEQMCLLFTLAKSTRQKKRNIKLGECEVMLLHQGSECYILPETMPGALHGQRGDNLLL